MTVEEANDILLKIQLKHNQPVELYELKVVPKGYWCIVDEVQNLTPVLVVSIKARDVDYDSGFKTVINDTWPLFSLEGLTETDLLSTVRLTLRELALHELDEAFTFDGKQIFDPHV